MDKLERVKIHMSKFESGSPIDEILEDYTENSVLEVQGNRFEGRDSIANFFTKTLEAFGHQKFENIEYKEADDGAVEVSWQAGPVKGGDKFYFNESGMFIRQKAYIGNRPEDF